MTKYKKYSRKGLFLEIVIYPCETPLVMCERKQFLVTNNQY